MTGNWSCYFTFFQTLKKKIKPHSLWGQDICKSLKPEHNTLGCREELEVGITIYD